MRVCLSSALTSKNRYLEEAGQVWSDQPKPHLVRQTGKANNSSQDVLSAFRMPGTLFRALHSLISFVLTVSSEVDLPICFYYYTIIFPHFQMGKTEA